MDILVSYKTCVEIYAGPLIPAIAVDVNIYTSSPRQAKPLIGNHENTEIGEFIRDYLDLDLSAITQELKEKGPAFDTVSEDGKKISWMGSLPDEGLALNGFDHYHGDFKRDLEHGHAH